VRRGLADLRETLAGLKGKINVAAFLVGNMIAADGLVALFAFGGIYAAGVFGWGTIEIGIFGILILVAGTAGAWFGGRVDDAIGPRRVMLGSLVLLVVACLAILSLGREHVLFMVPVAAPTPGALYSGLAEKLYVGIGLLIGIAAGPLQASARSLLVRLAPSGQSGQYFGLLALSGKVTSFLGPTLVAVATDLFVSQRAGLAVLIGFYAVAFGMLARVREGR
jgi:UMF1 family MFS transporter